MTFTSSSFFPFIVKPPIIIHPSLLSPIIVIGKRNENRKLYSDWIEDQLGLNNATRSRRRSRTSTKQKEMNVDGLKSFRWKDGRKREVNIKFFCISKCMCHWGNRSSLPFWQIRFKQFCTTKHARHVFDVFHLPFWKVTIESSTFFGLPSMLHTWMYTSIGKE